MNELLKLDFCSDAIITVIEMTGSEIESARKLGWSLRGVFEAERKADRYDNTPSGKQLFGVYAMPTSSVLKEAVEAAEKCKKDRDEFERKVWAAETKVKEAQAQTAEYLTALKEARDQIAAMKLASMATDPSMAVAKS